MNCFGVKGVPELKELAERCVLALPYFLWKYIDSGNLKQCMDAFLVRVASKEFKDPIGSRREIDSVGHRRPSRPIGCNDPFVFSAMKKEINRLKSFESKWTLQYIKPSELAASGMFYLGIDDHVQCAFCRGVIADWKQADVPLKEHAKHFPMCPFLLGSDVGNVPISATSTLKNWESHNSYPEYCPPSVGKKSFEIVFTVGKKPVYAFPLKYPSHGDIDVRMRTFTNWPASEVVRPEKLAEAGFFHTGMRDVVICFSCGGQLGNWEFGDDPWSEHAKHFSNCEYVKLIKGSSFIESVRSSGKQLCELNGTQSNTIPVPNACNSELFQKDTRSEQSACNNVPKSSNAKQYMCKVCMEEEAARVAFMPCGHSLACPRCAEKLTLCPLCRKKIDSCVRIYFE